MELVLIPGKGRYKDLPFYIKDHTTIYMLDEPGHHGDIIEWMKANDLIQGFNDNLIGGQFYFDGSELTFTLFGWEDDRIERWCSSMIPKLVAQGATSESFHDGTFKFHQDIAEQMEIPGHKWSTVYPEEDYDHWFKHVQNGGNAAFGWVDGQLYFGQNHSKITSRIVKSGMPFSVLINQPQMWGWTSRNAAYSSIPENGIDVRFSSDDKWYDNYKTTKKDGNIPEQAREAVMDWWRSRLPQQTIGARRWT